MRLGTRTTLAMLIAAIIPLALAGWSAIRLSQDSLEQRTMESHATNARLVAERIADGVRGQLRAVQLSAAAIDFATLGPEEKLWSMRLMFRQIGWASAIVLLNEDGSQAIEPVYLGTLSNDAGLSDRPILTDSDVQTFGASIPFESGLDVGSALGTPYVAADGSTRLALAVRTPKRQVLAVEIHLNVLAFLMRDHLAGKNGLAFVVDSGGFVILSADKEASAKRANRLGLTLVSESLAQKEATGYFEHPVLGESLGAGAIVPELGWGVVVAEPSRHALAASRQLSQQTLLWFLGALIGAIVLGVFFSRAILRPVEALQVGVKTLMEGDLSVRVPGDERGDELADLAKGFNQMAEEIQTWNQELETKVAEKTSALEESQELLVRAQKLAAIGELGAGLAHSVNNPLTGIISNVQLMLMDEEEGSENHQCLSIIEKDAKQIGVLIKKLSTVADANQGQHLQRIDVGQTVKEAMERAKAALRGASVESSLDVAADLPPIAGDTKSLHEALTMLIDNARLSMPKGGELTVSVEVREDLLVGIKIQDSGVGMSREERKRAFEPFYSSRAKLGAKGMGLARVHQIVENHQGQVTISSVVGEGTTVSVLLPAFQSRSIS